MNSIRLGGECQFCGIACICAHSPFDALHRFCGIILHILRFLFLVFGQQSPGDSSYVPTTLAAVRRQLMGGPGSSKANKGLRHFSLKVCEKVEQQQHTTYTQVGEICVQFAAIAP